MSRIVARDLIAKRSAFSREQALELGERLLSLTTSGQFKDNRNAVGVRILHTARAVTKVSQNRVLSTDDGDTITIQFNSEFGLGIPLTVNTNQINDGTLKHVIARVEAMLPPPMPPAHIPPKDPDSPARLTYNEREFPKVDLWHQSSADAMDTARAEVLPGLIELLQRSALEGAATIGLSTRSCLYLYAYGLAAFANETDCEVTVTARTPDGTGSGWGGEAHRNWSKVSPTAAVGRAIAFAQRARNPVAFEPGRRTVILGPVAVAQLVSEMAYAFDAEKTRRVLNGGPSTPFTHVDVDPQSRHTKLGRRVLDPRIMMVSDPADPLGGYPPFFEEGGIEMRVPGFPTPAITWIRGGVLENLAEKVSEAVSRDLAPSDTPRSVRLMVMPGVQTATVEEMIGGCEFGIYVNRFGNVAVLDEPTGMMTGVTRDGCFLIRDGKITKPIKNLRFLESPFMAFNRIEAIGIPERAAFGYDLGPGTASYVRWPKLPVVVPPMMIRDFNFSSMADAV
jgi:predicted Zn-dependent protease